MADIFSNMFFCNSSAIASPQPAAAALQRRQSAGPQDLSEYLKAFRSRDAVDEEWKRAHEKGRGKKRFKKLVNKQIIISKMQNLGVQKPRQSSAGSTCPQRYRPRGSLHESFLFTDQEQRRLAQIARENEENKMKREQYLKQNKAGSDRESLSSGQSRRRRKWKSKKNKRTLEDDGSSDGYSIDLEASMRSLENAFKIRNAIDETNEESQDEDKRNKTGDEDKEDDQGVEKDGDETPTQNLTQREENISSIENLSRDDKEDNDYDGDEYDRKDDESEQEEEDDEEEQQEQEKEDEEEEEEEEVKSSIKAEESIRRVHPVLIPAPGNLSFLAGKRRGSARSADSEGQPPHLPPSRAIHRSPRAARRVAPQPPAAPLCVRPANKDRSPSVAKSQPITPRASLKPPRGPPHKTLNITPRKNPTTLGKKSLTQPVDPFTSRNARKGRPREVEATPEAGAVRRKGGGAQSAMFSRSSSRSRQGARGDAHHLQKSPAKRPPHKPNIKGRVGNKDEKEDGVPMQNYGTVKF